MNVTMEQHYVTKDVSTLLEVTAVIVTLDIGCWRMVLLVQVRIIHG